MLTISVPMVTMRFFCESFMQRACLIIFLLFFATSVDAACCFCQLPKCRHQFEIGPEFYHVKRTRKGGTEQRGYLGGGRARYDYIARYHIYWGLETAYAYGTLRGKSGDEIRLKSHFSDLSFEARLGYTFQSKTGCCAQFIPFVGCGYFVERNDYVKPTPLSIHFRNTFYYTAVGAFSRAYITPNLTIGLELTTKFSIDGKVKVSHDSEVDAGSLRYENKIHFRAAVPFTYKMCFCKYPTEFCVAPFYEYRHYGHHHNVPFDFLDTKIKNFGLDLFYVIRF